jgi:uncharacterized protein
VPLIEALSFESGGVPCTGVFYRADGREVAPCVVMGHGFSGTQDQLTRYATAFAEHGLSVLTFDYRHFGLSGGVPRQVVDVNAQFEDWQAAVALARSLPGVDTAKIGLWGSSFSAGHVLRLAAGDSRIRAVAVQVPEFGFGSGSVLDEIRAKKDRKGVPLRKILRVGLGLFAAAVRDLLRAKRGLDPLYLPVFAPPGQLGAVIDHNYDRFLARAVETGATWRNEFAARLFLRPPKYRRGTAERVRVPLLVCVAADDTQTSPSAASAIARAAPQGVLRVYPADHFDVYTPALQDLMIAEQTRFLCEKLAPDAASPDAAPRVPRS